MNFAFYINIKLATKNGRRKVHRIFWGGTDPEG